METKQTIEALGALAHEHRLAIYRMLVEAGPAGRSAGVIAERLGVPPSSLTFHTQTLVRSGLATQHRVGRQLIFAADFAAMNIDLDRPILVCPGTPFKYQPANDHLFADIALREAEKRGNRG